MTMEQLNAEAGFGFTRPARRRKEKGPPERAFVVANTDSQVCACAAILRSVFGRNRMISTPINATPASV